MFLGINLSYFFYFYLKYFKKQLINRRKKGICTSEKGVGGLFGKGNGGRWRWRRRRLRIKVHVVKVEARPLDSQLLYVRQRLGMGLYLCGIDNSTIFFTTLFIFQLRVMPLKLQRPRERYGSWFKLPTSYSSTATTASYSDKNAETIRGPLSISFP